MRPEVGQPRRIKVLDRRKVAILEQASPEIVGAHLHPAFILPDGRWRCGIACMASVNASASASARARAIGIVITRVGGGFEFMRFERIEIAAQSVHAQKPLSIGWAPFGATW
ncbi:hypothetical protein GCM10011411_23300 [Aurantiacibacter arachoides]|nr:hypothetical protein GCM10011411_23300 [Aurantiacibacter arachoides]